MKSLFDEFEKIEKYSKRNLAPSYYSQFIEFEKTYKESAIKKISTEYEADIAIGTLIGYEKEWEFKQVSESIYEGLELSIKDQHPFMNKQEIDRKRESNRIKYDATKGVMPDFDVIYQNDYDFYPRVHGCIWFEHCQYHLYDKVTIKKDTFDSIRSVYKNEFDGRHFNVFVKGYSNKNENLIDTAIAYIIDDLQKDQYQIKKTRSGLKIEFESKDVDKYILFRNRSAIVNPKDIFFKIGSRRNDYYIDFEKFVENNR